MPGKQLVLRTDGSFRSAGYALMIEDIPDQKIHSTLETYADVAFGSKIFSPAQHKKSIYSEKNFGNLHGIFRVRTQSLGGNKAKNCSDRQQSRHTFFSERKQCRQSYGMYVIMCFNSFSKNTHCQFSQHCA